MSVIHSLGWAFKDADALRDALDPLWGRAHGKVTLWLDQKDGRRMVRFRDNAHDRTSYVLRDGHGWFLVISAFDEPKNLDSRAYAGALYLGYTMFKESLDLRPAYILLDPVTLAFTHTPADKPLPTNLDNLLSGIEKMAYRCPSRMMNEEERRQKAVEVAKLVVVRLDPSLPWCIVDPQRWGAAGAPGETALLSITSRVWDEETRPPFNFELSGCAMTVSLYHDILPNSPYSPILRFDDRLTFPLRCYPLESEPQRWLFEEHPELRVRVGRDDKRASPNASFRKGRARALDRERYPLVFVPGLMNEAGEGIVLVEPVARFNPRIPVRQAAGVN